MAQMVKEDKLKALDAALGQIEKQFGKGSVMKLGDSAANMNVETVPTGSLSLDIALGMGGVPKGRIIEIYGPESSGKTTVALHMVAEVQMPSTLLIPLMLKILGLILTISIFLSRTMENRLWRSLRLWSGPAQWILLS